jgi:predicted nucleic acid-binding Zn ribbon protein
MEHIKQTLQGVIQKLEKKQNAQAKGTFGLFSKNLAVKERRHAKCNSLRDGVLIVEVDSSAWLYQLSLKKDVLLKKLGLKDIRFRIGEIK